VYQDWTNHNYDFGDYGYKGGPPDRGAPDAVQRTYEWVVGNLTAWVNEGQPDDSPYASDARKSLGLLAHYLADVCQPLHTDDDASDSGKEHEEYLGRVGDYFYRMSYHSAYEKATTRAWEAYEYDLDAIRPDVTEPLYNGSAHDETLWCAQYANMGPDRTGRTTGYEGQNVGDHYQEVLEEIVYGFDNKIVTIHHGIEVEGTTDQLYDWTVDLLRLAATSLAKIIYNASVEAGVQPKALKMYVSDISFDEVYIHGRNSYINLECYVTIIDTDGNPVSGADVTINWTFPDGSTTQMVATTDENGVAYFVQENVDSGTHTVTVVDVVHSVYEYDPSLNVETTDSYTV